MPAPIDPIRQLQGGAADGDIVVWDNTAGEWKSTAPDDQPASGWVTGTSLLTETSSSFVLMTGMRFTVAVNGFYLMWFSGMVGGANANTIAEVRFRAGGFVMLDTRREARGDALSLTTFAREGGSFIVADETIDVEWRVASGSTVEVTDRQLAVMKVG